MKKTLLILITFLVSVISFGQHRTLFRDRFNNNKHQWQLYHDTDFIVTINKGKLYIEKFERNRIRNGCLWYSKPIPKLDLQKDFKIVFYAKALTYGDGFKAFDIQFGEERKCDSCNTKGGVYQVTTGSVYQIDFSPDRVRLALFKKPKGWEYYETSKTYQAKDDVGKNLNLVKDLIKENAFNKYEIKQTENTLTISINDEVVYQKEIKKISGSSIGIQQCSKGSWEIDKIIIKQ